ncbi:hypothetical protein COO91_00742 [Nostoc flagelliforme CCNUN1]|uniref:Uncharacterized protein n=1 Tax=Nostoc flagelliforme CCNUN1 TaxID=2038116 RepID=A0A2K8SHT7_9NOSO|nr:hypothetical protein COO91_00742 [Nostoc flagelliforme CCNUN1]
MAKSNFKVRQNQALNGTKLCGFAESVVQPDFSRYLLD